MNGGMEMEMDGKTEQKTGNVHYPSILDTATVCISFLFFNKKALYNLLLNKLNNFNLITLALISYLIPFKSPFTGKYEFFEFEPMIEGILMAAFFLFFLVMLCQRKVNSVMPLVRIILAMEVIAIISPVSFLLSGMALNIFIGLYFTWYITMSIFAFSHLNRYGYYRATISVLLAFFLTQLMPAVLS